MRQLACLYVPLAVLCVLTTAARSQFKPTPPPSPTELSTPPLVFSDHALWKEPNPDVPLLTAGCLPDGVPANAEFTAEPEPAWNTYLRGEMKMLPGIVKGGGKLRGAIWPQDVMVMLAPPVNANWMPARITRLRQAITLHVTSWDAPAGDKADIPRQRRGYLMLLGALAPGKYDLTLMCEHLKSDAQGRYQFTGETDTASKVLSVTEQGTDPPPVMEWGDLRTLHADVELGPAQVPPLHWARHIFPPLAPNLPSFDVKIGTLDIRAALAKLPAYTHDTVAPTPLAPGQAAPAGELAAAILSPTQHSVESMALDRITLDPQGGGCTLYVTLWRTTGGGGAAAPSKTLLLVPLPFLKKGEQTVTVKWQEYHARSPLTTYLQTAPPAPDAQIKVNVK